MNALRALAPGKWNPCLFLGPTREDGRHELVTVMDSLSLADELTLTELARGEGDEVVCPGVDGENLASAALAAFREAARVPGPPWWRVEISKRVPVAAGMGGGSGDAAAALRLAAAAVAALGLEDLEVLAARLGADVPAQVRPGRVLATGAGEHLRHLPDPAPYGLLVLPSRERLSTPAVFAEADRLGLPRDAAGLARALAEVEAALPDLPFVNELEPAARSLCPAIDEALDAARQAGADVAMVSGSGPTVVGFFRDPAGAERAARALANRDPAPVAAIPVTAQYGAPR
jgi:4-diphosphocytidyl-2-C-methyl-D-erythritol kinase